jgi:mono/diheme cytochrome c family protein
MLRTFLGRTAIGLGILLGTAAARGESPAPEATKSADTGRSLFDDEVREIMIGKCLSCHGPDQKKGGLDLSRRSSAVAGGESGEAIVPGKPDESLIVEKVAAGEMPPKNPLSSGQIKAIRSWVSAGALYVGEPLAMRRAGANWWSLQPIRRPEPPTISPQSSSWTRNPIDAFIQATLDKNGLTPSPAADRRTLIRRVSFDLIGLPPTPEEVEDFERDDRPDAYERVVDRLLDSPHFGERWGRHWLDVVRFGESHGYETNMPRPNAWPYRDYVIHALNRDTPFPRFVLEQLAGDTLQTPDSGSAEQDLDDGAGWLVQAATGFLVGGTHDQVGNAQPEAKLQQRVEDLDDVITATGTAFLGLTVNCARCHDHKFDPISQKDYYGMQAVFAGVNHADRAVPTPDAEARKAEALAVKAELARIDLQLDASEPVARVGVDTPGRLMVNPHRNVERFAPISARSIRLTILATSNNSEPCIDEIEAFTAGPEPRNVAAVEDGAKAWASSEYPGAAIHKIAHLNDGRYGNDRSWISHRPGKGIVTIDWPEPASIDRVVWGRDRTDRFRDRLATDYFLEVKTSSGDWKVVASSLDRRSYDPAAKWQATAEASSPQERERNELLARQTVLRDRLAMLGQTMSIYAGTFSQPGESHVLRRGDPTQPGALVSPTGISAVKPPLMIDPKAPEARRRVELARWIADPQNPLANRVLANRLWHYHFGRGIVATPSDFGFNGSPPSHPRLLDWLASELLANGGHQKPLHRLMVTSATYRQANRPDPKAQAIDKQNRLLWRMSPRRHEAESIRDAILACGGQLDDRMGGPGYNIWEKNTNYVAVYKPRTDLAPDTFRRMVYQFKPRSQQDPTFGSFDCPSAALVAPRRTVSTTALQALNLFNSRFVLQQSEAFAKRLAADAGPDPARQVERGFALAFGRTPNTTETTAAVALIKDHGASAFCRALYNSNEFLYSP